MVHRVRARGHPAVPGGALADPTSSTRPPRVSEDAPIWAASELAKLGPITSKELTMAGLAVLALLGWIFAGATWTPPWWRSSRSRS